MNNSTRNLKMKKLLIASTALVATAGMAAADVTVTGHAAAGYHSNLFDNTASGDVYADSGIYSNVGVDFTMSGATDSGVTFGATLNIDAGEEIDAADYHLDGTDGGTAGLGSVTVGGAFGTLTFDNDGIDNIYNDAYTAMDVSYSTTLSGVAVTVAMDVNDSSAAATSGKDDMSFSAGYGSGAMAYTLTGSNNATSGMSYKLNAAYTVSDALTVSASTKSNAGAATSSSVAEVKAVATVSGLSITAASDNATASGWDLDLGYTINGIALAYGTDEKNTHDINATYALGGGATFHAGMKNWGTDKASQKDSAYAGVSFAF